VLDVFRLHPGLAKSIVVSLPADLAESGQHRAALEILSGLDIRFAAEDWSGSQGGLDKLKQAGVRFVKLAADRLLDRTRARKGAPSGTTLFEMAREAGIDVIATDVRSDEDAVSLIDIGIDLMTGERLAPPRRLKDDGGGAIKSK
jgi:EAL domain-containing protein (putative c-di-GMP-specific phosphodiesterase class I)